MCARTRGTEAASIELSKEALIQKVIPGGGHLVILGAGASRALSEEHGGDKNGVILPVMNELVDVLGLEDTIRKTGFKGDLSNFELVYSKLHDTASKAVLAELNEAIVKYFRKIKIPDALTNYDLLLAGLRKRDFVATFNWDPLLSQAYRRLVDAGLGGHLPQILSLHGNVDIGYCSKDGKAGQLSSFCQVCGNPYTPTPLLYPVGKKDYQGNEYIKAQWDNLQKYMGYARVVTIYGYSAPHTDVAARELLQKGWGTNTDRAFEQFELIVRPGTDEQIARDNWETFIHTHHYRVHDDFSQSSISMTPRRTMELWWAQNLEAKFVEPNPYPTFTNMAGLVDWVKPLIEAEMRAAEEKAIQPKKGVPGEKDA